ncbi:CoA transferase [Tepidiforma flava]|uniref:CoA transferase n=1 Tax=Tepidiforma flava TaxID=3004094 RepID=A0ABY7M6N8_9CHLR|nr:CoA transferase [Tepidiforma flava]WBL36201.1 CoA transferase [Tepidiforma flava]
MSESPEQPVRKPFEGIRVADFAWVGVGPLVSKYLADHGAEVIRIESATYPETLRRVGPFVDDVPNVDGSGYFANFNSSKLGVSVNFKHPRGRSSSAGSSPGAMSSPSPTPRARWPASASTTNPSAKSARTSS